MDINFWLLYWISAGLVAITSTVIVVAINQELNAKDLLIILALVFVPVINMIAVIIGVLSAIMAAVDEGERIILWSNKKEH